MVIFSRYAFYHVILLMFRKTFPFQWFNDGYKKWYGSIGGFMTCGYLTVNGAIEFLRASSGDDSHHYQYYVQFFSYISGAMNSEKWMAAFTHDAVRLANEKKIGFANAVDEPVKIGPGNDNRHYQTVIRRDSNIRCQPSNEV